MGLTAARANSALQHQSNCGAGYSKVQIPTTEARQAFLSSGLAYSNQTSTSCWGPTSSDDKSHNQGVVCCTSLCPSSMISTKGARSGCITWSEHAILLSFRGKGRQLDRDLA